MPDNLNQPKVTPEVPLEPAPEVITSPASPILPTNPSASPIQSVPAKTSTPPPPPPPLPKSEILTPDIAPKKPSKTKIILVSLVGLFLLGAVAGAVVLVQQRQQTGVSAGSAAPGCPEGYTDGGTHGECCACGKAKEVRTCTAPDGSQTWTSSDCVHDAPNCTDGCSGDNCIPEGSSGCTSKSCCTASNVCHNNVCTACGSITNEGTCWTHSNCHWANGSCQTGAMPTVTGDCKIDCGADRNGVSVTAQAGSETACSGAVVTASYFAKTCNSSNSCTGASTTATGGLPFTRSTSGDDCGYYQTDIVASTNKGGSCRNASAGPLGACTTPTTPRIPTDVISPPVREPTPTVDLVCTEKTAYLDHPTSEYPFNLDPVYNIPPNSSVLKGQTFLYAISYKNNGTGVAKTSTITDVLPSQLEFINSDAGCSYNSTNKTLTCALGDVGPRGESQVAFRAKVLASASDGSFTNKASVNYQGGTTSNCQIPLTITSLTCSCETLQAYSQNWTLLTSDDLAELKAGNVINLTVQGITTGGGQMDKARFRINGGNWQETENTKTFNDSGRKFYIEYTIPANTTNFNVEAEVHLVETDQWY